MDPVDPACWFRLTMSLIAAADAPPSGDDAVLQPQPRSEDPFIKLSPADRAGLEFTRWRLFSGKVRAPVALSHSADDVVIEAEVLISRGTDAMHAHTPMHALLPCRYRRVGLDLATVLSLCITGARTQDVLSQCVEGLPDGTHVVGADVQYVRLLPELQAVLWLTCEHPQWPLLSSGQQVPEIVPVFRDTDAPLVPAD